MNSNLYKKLLVIGAISITIGCGNNSNDSESNADAGPDASVNENTEYTLGGRGSEASASSDLSFYWRQTSGQSVVLTNADTAQPSFIAPEVHRDDANTDLVFELTVEDGDNTDRDSVKITVIDTTIYGDIIINANAGPDDSIVELNDYTLSGAATINIGDQAGDLDTLSYSWSQTGGPDVSLTGADTASPSFTAPAVDNNSTVLTFDLNVSNGTEADTDTVAITINNLTSTPVAAAGADETATAETFTVSEGSSFVLVGSGSTPNGDTTITNYNWTGSGNLAVSNEDTTVPNRTITTVGVDTDTEYTFSLVITDANGDVSLTDTVTVTVLNDGPDPTATVQDLSVQQNTLVDLMTAITASDDGAADADLPLTYSFNGPDGLSVDGNGQFTSPSVEESTVYTFGVSVSNGLNTSEVYAINVTVEPEAQYNGRLVELEGNPFTVLNDAIDLGNDVYDVQIVGTNAYVTYYDRRENVGNDDPNNPAAGLLVVDVSDEKNLQVTADYRLPFPDGYNLTSAQMNLTIGLDAEANPNFAYIVDRGLATNAQRDDELYMDLVRIDLSADPAGELPTYASYYTLENTRQFREGDPDRVNDALFFNGSLYASAEDRRALYKIDPTSNPALTADIVGEIWRDEDDADNDGSLYDELAMQSLDDGYIAVMLNDNDLQVIRTDVDENVVAAYRVTSTISRFDGTGVDGERHITIDEAGEYVYVSFKANDQVNERFVSSVEKIDIRQYDDEANREATVYIHTSEDANDLAHIDGITYVAGGRQGVQVWLEDDSGINLHTYYQTPMRAEDLIVSLTGDRIYVIGDQSLAIIDTESQESPAVSTNWIEDFRTTGEFAGRASDVEIVTVANPDNVDQPFEYAVVAEGSDTDGQNTQAKLHIFDINTDEIVTSTADLVTSRYEHESYEDIKLTNINGRLYANAPYTNSENLFELTGIGADNTVVTHSNGGFRVTALTNGFANSNGIFPWAGDAIEGSTIINNHNFFALDTLGDGRFVGTAETDSFSGCAVIDDTFSYYAFNAFKDEGAVSFYTGTYDQDRQVCYSGYGFHQEDVNDGPIDNVQVAEWSNPDYDGPYGIQTVVFGNASGMNLGEATLNQDDIIEDGVDVRMSTYELADNPEDITQVGERLYVANNTFGGVQILDASNPLAPVLAGVIHTEDRALGVAINRDETMAVIADDNIRGIVKVPLVYPTLDRTDNDNITLATDEEGNRIMTDEQIALADMQAVTGSTLTYTLSGEFGPQDRAICYTSEDATKFGDENCTVSESEGVYTVTWNLSDRVNENGEVVDQEMRVALGNNIDFLSSSTKVFVNEVQATEGAEVTE